MDLELEGRVALVTGVSRGIGWATAARLLREKATVIGMSRTRPVEPLDGLQWHGGDVTSAESRHGLIGSVTDAFGRLDVLVNCAGAGTIRRGYEDVEEQDWRATWELLFLSTVELTAAALPQLVASGSGVVVNVSSRNARVPVRAVPDYSAAKAALNNYSKGLASQYAADGLRVVTISPGPTATPLWLGPDGAAAQSARLEGTTQQEQVDAVTRVMPHGRMVGPDEVADLIAFVASPRAESLSGIDILIDGGLTQTT